MTGEWDVVVVGAGAAGLLAATRATDLGQRVLLVEKNRKPGVKILMSGGTRCNLTHAVEARHISEAFGRQGRFLHSALAALGPADLVELIESQGVKTKVEATGKIFPASDKAADVLAALLKLVHASGAELALAEAVSGIERRESGWCITTSTRQLLAAKLIVTTGGQSYPGCGTTGDGYDWARALGHTIVPPRPALVPVTIRADWAKSLRGVTIPDIGLQLWEAAGEKSGSGESIAAERGSFLFTHFGLSGPVVLDISREITLHPRPRSLELVCDFLPEMSADQLEQQLRELAASDGKKQIAVLVARLLPRRLADALAALAGISPERRAAELTRAERASMAQAIKGTHIPVTGTMGFVKAEVTAGGVSLEEVDSRTMQSKLCPNLYFAGEILDLDGPIGGYNFQAAFSTGWVAGARAGEQ